MTTQRRLSLPLVFAVSLLLSLCVALPSAFASPDKDVRSFKQTTQQSHVDLVIALDTSNSMDGLINSARQKLWDVVNDLATAKPSPRLRVGIISFGNDSYSPETGWTRVDVPLTEDLDMIYEKLMALRTHGGTEYVGRAVYTARTQMNWSRDPKALKMVFVAGNESADQDAQYKAMSEAAASVSSDIVVNTIFCGNPEDRVAVGWRNVAQRSQGQFVSINQNAGAVAVATPYDDRLNALNTKLNTTYIPYGTGGIRAKERQTKMDASAMGMSGGAGAARAAAKSSGLYRNDSWDLVDGLNNDTVELENVQDEALPAPMRNMNTAQRKAYVKRKSDERKAIQKQIRDLNTKREAYIRAEKKKSGKKSEDAFDTAVRKTLRAQAKKKGILIP